MAAVAVTAGTRRDFVLGNLRAVKATLTSVDDGDTWVPGLSIVETIQILNTTADPTGNEINASITNGTAGGSNQATVTFDVQSGATNQSVIAVAYGY